MRVRMKKSEPKTTGAEVTESPALSPTARLGDGGIRTRKIAILVADGVEGESIAAPQTALVAEGAVPRLVGIRVGRVVTASGEEIEADASDGDCRGFTPMS